MYRKVVIICEDLERTEKIVPYFKKYGAQVVIWSMAAGSFDLNQLPCLDMDTIYYCRLSPSMSLRHQVSSYEYVKDVLYWLSLNGAKCVNGISALEVEFSKSKQNMLLKKFGFQVPNTQEVFSYKELIEICKSFKNQPIIVKPNTGGSGMGIKMFDSGNLAVTILRHNAAVKIELEKYCPSKTWIVQRLHSFHDALGNRNTMKTLFRFEIVFGAVQKDYCLQIYAPVSELKLCPCDPVESKMLDKIRFTILTDPHNIPAFGGSVEKFDAFCTRVSDMFVFIGAEIGSIECILDKETNELMVIDVNMNTNYNAEAEVDAKIIPGGDRIARCVLRGLN